MKRIDRFDVYMSYKKLNDNKVTKQLSLSNGVLGKSRKEGRDLSDKVIEKIEKYYTDLNIDWLVTGDGEMIRADKKIPLYDDDATIGGTNGMVANVDDQARVTEWIDAGDWFPSATSAIHHYGDSMVEYPSGSILALEQGLAPNVVQRMAGHSSLTMTESYTHLGDDWVKKEGGKLL